MTDLPAAKAGDPVWEAALDWLFLVQESPDDPALRARLQAWLDAGEAHRRAWAKAQKVWNMSGVVMTSPGFECPLPAVATPAPRVEVAPRRRWLRRTGLGSAIAACALLATLLDWQGLGADYRSPAGEHRQVTLADGSQVELDSGSAIDVQFSDSRRQVTLLRGQAFFDVKPEPGRPFQVEADTVQVTVTGTAFAVEMAPASIEIGVARGSVRVDAPHAVSEQLKPGQGLRLARQGQGLGAQRLQVPVEQIAAWRHWQLLAIDQPLSDLVARLRRYQPGLILLDERLGQRKITAALDLRAPHQALQAAVAPLGARVEAITPFVLRVSAD